MRIFFGGDCTQFDPALCVHCKHDSSSNCTLGEWRYKFIYTCISMKMKVMDNCDSASRKLFILIRGTVINETSTCWITWITEWSRFWNTLMSSSTSIFITFLLTKYIECLSLSLSLSPFSSTIIFYAYLFVLFVVFLPFMTYKVC